MAPKTRGTTSTARPKLEGKAKVSKATKPTTKRKGSRKVTSKYFEDREGDEHDEVHTEPIDKAKRKTSSSPSKARKPKKAKIEEEEEEPKPDPSQFQVLKYLLSPAALELCRPSDESKEFGKNPPKSGYRTYSGSTFTPFEELLSAIILSRPISHSLGHRSIRTILNPPYNFSTPKTILKAGQKKVLQSMFDARTQHKEKTAIGIVRLAEVVAENFGGEDDTSLEVVREQCDHDVGKEGELLKSSIYGMGTTGLNIFFRRVQWKWPERFPFMDERTETAAGALGLPDDAEELCDSVDAMWDLLDAKQFDGKDEDEKKRRAIVVLLERIIGAHLEKKVTKVLREAENLSEDDLDKGDAPSDDEN
jgi:hypothetical protein